MDKWQIIHWHWYINDSLGIDIDLYKWQIIHWYLNYILCIEIDLFKRQICIDIDKRV